MSDDLFLRPLTEVLRDLQEAQRYTKVGSADWYWYEDEIEACIKEIERERNLASDKK